MEPSKEQHQIRESSQVFVAIPFSEDFREIYEDAVRPAILDAGLVPFRVDEVLGHRDIVADIEQGIKDSLLVFADLTGQNSNVFYELGFARATGKPLVVVTQNEQHVPFDLRQRRYIKYSATGRGVQTLRRTLTEWFRHAIAESREGKKMPHVLCHGTKFDVPNRNDFWNNLLRQAERRFYLLGGSNKSWVDKSERQSIELANSLVRIATNGGEIKILSGDGEDVIQSHKKFFSDYVLPRATTTDPPEGLKEILRKSLKYAVYAHSNYGAVISDDRLVLLPTLNSPEFRDETLVLEIWGPTSPQFLNYLGDIDRMLRNGAREIDLFSSSST